MGRLHSEMSVPARASCTGAAWLSSARVVRCWVKSRNERNPRLQLPAVLAGHSEGTAGDKPEEGGDDVKSSWPLYPGLHTCYNGGDSGKLGSDAVLISKSHLSSDCTLQLGCMKVESLVIADQHAAVNTFPGLPNNHQTDIPQSPTEYPKGRHQRIPS